MREQDVRLAFLGPAGEWDPHQSPSCPQEEKRGRRKRRAKRRCLVMPAHGPTAPPQMSKLGLREGVAGKDLLVGRAERTGGWKLHRKVKLGHRAE